MTQMIEALRVLRPVLRMQTLQGQPVTVGERQITPLARSLLLAVGRPGGPLAAGLVWNRPVAVLETWRGQTRRVPIPDLTRRFMLALVVSGLLFAMAARYVGRRHKNRTRGVEL